MFVFIHWFDLCLFELGLVHHSDHNGVRLLLMDLAPGRDVHQTHALCLLACFRARAGNGRLLIQHSLGHGIGQSTDIGQLVTLTIHLE